MATPPNLPTNHADSVGEVITATLVNDLAAAANDIATNGAIPKGAAGGVLQGSYPNPVLVAGVATGAVLGADVITTGGAQTKTGILTAPFRDKGGHAINVKAYGAIGDITGATHPISAADISANSQWIGTYTAGDEWDYVGIQETIYACFATASTPGNVVWNGVNNSSKNRPLYFPAGYYRLNKTLVTNYVVGGVVYGDGRLASKLIRVTTFSGTTHNWSFNGLSHTFFRDFGLGSTGNHGTDGSLLDFNWDNTAGGGGLHGCGVTNVHFDGLSGGANIDYLVRVAYASNQGDTFDFKGCFFASGRKAGFGCWGFNALTQNFINCDFIGDYIDDIYISGGTVNTYNCQVEGTAWGTSRKSGFFVTLYVGAGNHGSAIKGTRGEVPQLVQAVGNGPGHVSVEDCFVSVGASHGYTALTAYVAGQTVRGNSGVGLGSIYLCTTSGTTGAGEPTWAVGGATVADGTVVWTHQDVVSLSIASPAHVKNCLLPFTRVEMGARAGPQTIENCTFSRADWLSDLINPFDHSAGGALVVQNCVVTSTGLAGQPRVLYTTPSRQANVDTVYAYNPTWRSIDQPIIWMLGNGAGTQYGDIGLGRDDGTALSNASSANDQTRYSRNRLNLLGDGSLGRPNPTTADTAGSDLRLQGGLSTGTGVGGAVSLRASPAGGAGSAVNNAAEIFSIDTNGCHVHGPTVANGQSLDFKTLTELTTIAAAATTSTTIQIPAGAVVWAVSVRVTVTIPTAATMMIGDGTTAAKFNTGANIAVSAGTTDVGTKAGPTYYAAATSIVITPNLTPGTTAGRVRVTIHYYQATPPTS